MTTRPEEQDLDKAIPCLLNRTDARVGNAFAHVVKPHGLSLTEWRICVALLHTPEQTLSALAAYAVIDLSALSRIVDRLVERRLMRRKRSPNDKRAVVVSLSAKGLALTRAIVPLARRHESAALAGFDAGEVRVLRAMLERLHRNAQPR